MIEIGRLIGLCLNGGEIIELIGDVGAGKTTFVKGLAKGLGVDDTVQSPSFMISRNYRARDDLFLCHYDFYRLENAGIMQSELAEAISDNNNIVVVEWSGLVVDLLPESRIVLKIETVSNHSRKLKIDLDDVKYGNLIKELSRK